MTTWQLIFYVLAFACFVLGAIPVTNSKVNLVSLGLAFATFAACLLPRIP